MYACLFNRSCIVLNFHVICGCFNFFCHRFCLVKTIGFCLKSPTTATTFLVWVKYYDYAKTSQNAVVGFFNDKNCNIRKVKAN